MPEWAWTPAYDGYGTQREGADVAELTKLVDLSDWPPGMRVIVPRERPHAGAQLRATDIDGNRITCFVTNTRRADVVQPMSVTLPVIAARSRTSAVVAMPIF